MELIKGQSGCFIRLNRGEEIFSSLEHLAREQGWRTAHLSGIGALMDLTLGHYDLEQKKYFKKQFPGTWELLSMEGNLTAPQEGPFYHLHGVFSDHTYNCIGGHLFEATVAVTCEINLRPFDVETTRQFDPAIGLNLITRCPL